MTRLNAWTVATDVTRRFYFISCFNFFLKIVPNVVLPHLISELIIVYISKYFSIIHKGKSPKSSIKVNWAKPLDYDGQDLYLRYSIVMEKSQYWVGLAYPPKLDSDSEIDQFETSG